MIAARSLPLLSLVVFACAGCGRPEAPQVVAVRSATVPVASASAPATPVRYAFIDGGAHLGETVLSFEKTKLFQKHPWSVVSFEPNPELVPQIPKRPFLTVMPNAIWTKDEELEFHFSHHETLGGSVMNTYVALPEMNTVKVKAIDFGQWLKRTYRKEDVVYVKLDIEGAEYPVLEQMLQDGTMALVDKLFIEFHGVQQIEARKHTPAEVVVQTKHDYELVEAITGLGIAVSLHQTDEVQGSYFDFDPDKYHQPW